MMDSSQGSKPKVTLPPLRDDITYAFNDYDHEGKPQWLIHDPGRNKFFLIGWLEHEILTRWQLGDPEAIIKSIADETTLAVEMSDIENFLKYLSHNFLIKQSGYRIHATAKDLNLFRADSWIHWLIEHYLFFRIPLAKPDSVLTKTKMIGKIFFHRYTVTLMILLGLFALYEVSTRWEMFTHTFPTVFTWQGIFFYLVAFLICKFFHELGHAYMCKSFGVPVPTFGVAFLVFWPVLYTDTTLSWTLNNKQRMRIALAGVWLESYVTVIAAIVWCYTSNLTIQSICYLIITVNWIASLLINVSPFMRFDGYYVLADLVRMPNLQPRAFALTRWQIRRWLFHWAEPPPEIFSRRMHWFLVTYSFMTWIYRLIIYIGIAVLVYHFFIKIAGIILFAIELFYFILAPIVNELRFWFNYRERFSFNLRTRITAFFIVLLLLIFFLPISESVKMPAILSHDHQFFYAPEDGVLKTALPSPGTIVKKNQIIAVISSPNLEQLLREVRLNYLKTLEELRRSTVQPAWSSEKGYLLSAISKQQSEYDKLIERFNRLTLKAPFNGKISEIATDLSPGTVVMKNDWLGDIVDPNVTRIEAYVSQIDRPRLKIGLTGNFYPENLEENPVRVTVKTIEIINARELTCHYSPAGKTDPQQNITVETPCYQISDFGGAIPTLLSPEGRFVPVTSVYRVILETNSKEQLPYIEKGSVIVKTTPASFASRFFYHFKKLLIEQSAF